MTYVLLYINTDKQPCYIQGSLDSINEQLRTLWLDGDIDRDDWRLYLPWELLGIEDDRLLTPLGNVKYTSIPHFEVH